MRASFGGLCLLALAGPAEAADARRRFAIPSKPYAEALIDLAVQADISLLGASSCGAGGRTSLMGVYTLDQALQRLLAGAPCSYRLVDAATVRILPSAAASPPPHQVAAAAPLVTELMVTARKRPERLDTLPAGVSVLSGEQLRAAGAVDPRDTAGLLVGVTATNLGPGRDKLLMRGLSDGAFTGRARSTVGTYLDDTPINYNAPDPDLRLVDVERVETVRGPQGSLYGSGALAGVYRVVANKPDPETLSAAVAAGQSWTKGGSPSREIEAVWNAPVVHDRAAVRLVGYYDLQGGYLDDVTLGLSNVDRTTRTGGRAAARVQLGDRWRMDVSAAVQRLRSMDTQYTTDGLAPGQRANRIREAHDNDFALGSLVLDGDLGFADLSSSTAYVRHDFSSKYDASTAAGIFDITDSELGVYSERARTRRLVQDLVLRSPDQGGFRWLAGAYASSSLERTPSSLLVGQPQGRLSEVYREARRDNVRDFAVYGEASYTFADAWTVSAGGRLFQTRVKTTSDIVVAPPGQSRVVAGRRSFSGFSPKLSLQYEIAPGQMIYGLYSEGYRAGGINSTGFSAIKPERATFAPDRLRNVELGAKGRFLDGRLAVRAAAFYDRWTDIQSDQYRRSGLAYTANVGDARIIGLETEFAIDFDFGLSLQANALLAEPKFTRTNPDFVGPLGAFLGPLGTGLPGAPRVSGGVLARYERPLGDNFTLRLVGEASYIGRSRQSFETNIATLTGAYVQARLSAEVAAQHWSVGVFVVNPNNSTGDTFGYGNPFTFGQVRQTTPQRPRTIGVRLATAF
ncbi:MAG: TonB-dependent receptor [Phenylobacterium sp.]|nr:TonB-dependent receptor [Phenylobacterium sp.]